MIFNHLEINYDSWWHHAKESITKVMLYTVASEECKRGVVVVFANSFDQASGMQVARCFASDKKVFHIFMICASLN